LVDATHLQAAFYPINHANRANCVFSSIRLLGVNMNSEVGTARNLNILSGGCLLSVNECDILISMSYNSHSEKNTQE
jgi:hypothetical protein